MPTHKLTRKEMKHDGFMEWTAHATEYVQENYTRVGLVIVIVIAAIFGVRFIVVGQAKSAQQAAALLYRAESLMQRGAWAEARQPLEELRSRHGGSKFAAQGAFDLAQVQAAVGQNDAALTTIEQAGKGADPAMAHALGLLKASILGSMKRFTDAEAACRQVLQGGGLSARERFDATILLADTLRLGGKLREAVDVLVALQNDINSGKLDTPARDLDSRIQLLKSLAG